jgi:16S rRNA processing protein RimM
MELVVARIGRPQGLRGEVSIEVRTDDPDGRFVVGRALRTDPASAGPLTVRSMRRQGARTILAFDAVTDRSAAEGLRGVFLVVDVDQDIPAAAGAAPDGDDAQEWYDHQLIGLRARHVDGRALGAVVDVLHMPAQDLLAVRPAAGEDVLVPFVTALVPIVDVRAGHVVIDPPGGLFEPVPEESEDSDDADDADDADQDAR